MYNYGGDGSSCISSDIEVLVQQDEGYLNLLVQSISLLI